MALERLTLREGSRRKTSYDFNPMWNLKEENKQNRDRLTDTENKLVAGRGKEVWRRVKTGPGLRGTDFQLENESVTGM